VINPTQNPVNNVRELILPEIRCSNVIVVHGSPRVCNGLLMKGRVIEVQIKCSKCGEISSIRGNKVA